MQSSHLSVLNLYCEEGCSDSMNVREVLEALSNFGIVYIGGSSDVAEGITTLYVADSEDWNSCFIWFDDAGNCIDVS